MCEQTRSLAKRENDKWYRNPIRTLGFIKTLILSTQKDIQMQTDFSITHCL